MSTPTSPRWLRPSLDWLLLFVPVAIAIRFVPAFKNDTLLFITACLAIIPLAGIMGKATEHLTSHVGEGIGGLLNATFGNAAELIIALMALSKGLFGVVKASITGSIIGNILLVLGISLLGGGLKFPKQKFNRTAAHAVSTALLLSAITLLIPTVFHFVATGEGGGWTPVAAQRLSLAIAIVLFLTYGAILLFSLKTHKELFAGTGDELDELEGPEGHAPWTKAKSVTVLLIATMFVALISEFLVGSVEAARERLGLTEVFVGVVVVAIIGNAAEHSTAVLFAIKNKLDLTLSIAIGSSLQIALFVAPVLVFASYAFGRPMDLEFTIAEVVAVFAAVLIVGQITADGESNWLEGFQLLSIYAVLGILFFFLPEPAHREAATPAPHLAIPHP
jgi:Ca2+:H+ antiporter